MFLLPLFGAHSKLMLSPAVNSLSGVPVFVLPLGGQVIVTQYKQLSLPDQTRWAQTDSGLFGLARQKTAS